ncbi:MAG: hypothetical protein ACLP3R_02640 [Candidatus Korobacteraceae bacterium]|jgi:hypothetical protein
MANERAPLETIDDFLTQKRIAMAGISRAPANFSVQLSNTWESRAGCWRQPSVEI